MHYDNKAELEEEQRERAERGAGSSRGHSSRYEDSLLDSSSDLDSGELLVNPGDFDDLERSKSFNFGSSDGVTLFMSRSLVPTPEAQRAAASIQMQIQEKNHSLVYILEDGRSPVSVHGRKQGRWLAGGRQCLQH